MEEVPAVHVERLSGDARARSDAKNTTASAISSESGMWFSAVRDAISV